MNGWRGTWAAAQITGVIFSSLVWIVLWGLSLPAFLVMVAVGVAGVAVRNSQTMLWWRFGASRANDLQRDAMLTAIVPIVSLRGRRQPSIWIGRRIFGAKAVFPSSTVLVLSPELVRQVANGQLTDRQAGAIVSQALGRGQVLGSTLVNALEIYCLPWRFVQIFVGAVSPVAARHGTLKYSWKMRWIVFAVAAIENYLDSRWPAFVGVIAIAVLPWAADFFQKRWDRRCWDMGDERTISEHLGPDLADLIQRRHRSLATSERVDRLRRCAPGGEIGAGRRTPVGAQPSRPPVDHLDRRSSAGRQNS